MSIIECPECGYKNPSDNLICQKCEYTLSPGDLATQTTTKTVKVILRKLPIGSTFAGRYKVISQLGKGGMGRVYRVLDEEIGEEIALKLLSFDVVGDEKNRDRFRNELKLSRKISHKNVCRVYHLGEERDAHYITMEYVPGEDLKSLIRKKGKIPLDQALDVTKQMCEGLMEAHGLGVVHCDLKPQNIMVDKKGTVKILDFGIARTIKAKGITDTGVIIGTPNYMSPEQSEGEEADSRSDIYSLGIILYEMVTGRTPFKGNTALSILVKHKSEMPPDPRIYNSRLPDNLCSVILECLEKKRHRRYQNVKDLLSDLEDIEKGKAPIPIPTKVRMPSFLLGVKDSQVERERPVFVAREKELEVLDRTLNEAFQGKGGVVFITGDAGSGKTALMQEFFRRCQAKHSDLIIADGNCNAHTGIGDVYLPFREVLGLLTGDVETRWVAGSISHEHALSLWDLFPLTVKAIVESGPELIDSLVKGEALIARTLDYKDDCTEWLSRLEKIVERKSKSEGASKMQQSDLFEQYTRVLLALEKEKPILLLLDDLQWADVGSICLLFHLGKWIKGSKILMVGAYRSGEVSQGRGNERHPLEPVINELKRDFGDISVNLGQTGDRQFIDAFLDTEPNMLDVSFRDTLYQQTKGHPLFTIELLRNMKEKGMIVQNDEGKWVECPALNWDALPERVEAVIGERIGKLSGDMKEILTTASVEGEEFTAEVVARLRGIEDFKTVKALSNELDKRHHLVQSIGIRKKDGNRLSIYRFRHILFQKYLYNGLDEAERTYLHEKVGNGLEALYKDRADEIAVQLVRHFHEAGIEDKELNYLEKAGERALRGHANHEAVDFFNKALELNVRLEKQSGRLRRARWEQKLGRAYLGIGRLTESRIHLEKALALLNNPVPTRSWMLVLGLIGQIFRQVVHRIAPSRFMSRASDADEVFLVAARSYEHLSEICYYFQEKMMAIYAGLGAINLTERIQPTPELARQYANLCLGAGVVSLHSLAETYSRKAREIAQIVDPLHTFGYTLMVTATYHLGMGHWEKVRHATDKAIEIFLSVGDLRNWEVTLSIQALLALCQGDFKGGAKAYGTLFHSAIHRDDPQNQCWGLVGQALNKLRLGNTEKAIKLLNAVNIDALRHEHRFEKVWFYGVKELAGLRRGDIPSDYNKAEEVLQLFTTSDPRCSSLMPYSALAETFLSLWERSITQNDEEQKAVANLALNVCKGLSKYAKVFPIGQPSAQLYYGLCCWLDKSYRIAWNAWKKGLAAAERLGMPYEKALLYYEIGKHSSGEKRRKYLCQAVDIFSRIDTRYDLERAKAELINSTINNQDISRRSE